MLDNGSHKLAAEISKTMPFNLHLEQKEQNKVANNQTMILINYLV